MKFRDLRAWMSSRDRPTVGWTDGDLPDNVRLGHGSCISGLDAFKRFFSKRDIALSLGDRSRTDGVKFAIGPQGHVAIGRDCYLNDCILLAEQEIRIGNYVMIGWNTTVSDGDFHPIAPAERISDAIALSPLAEGRVRPKALCQPVFIGDNVFIGPACTILKGVTIGDGAYVEAGSVITRSVGANAHVQGNPAVIVSVDET
jgi:acetyltransferase-like isoleucine patch superfamily enzyme